MNVLQIVTPSRVSGAERSAISLCLALRDAGHRVLVVTKPHADFEAFVRSRGLEVRPLRISGKLNLLAPGRLARLAEEFGADLLHTHLSTAAWSGALAGRLAGRPVISHVRALNSATAFRLADRVIAISHAVKRHLVSQGMEADLIDVVYTGIDPDEYQLPFSREEAKARLGYDADALVTGVVAHLTPKKGHHVFLEALSRVTERVAAVHALLVGEGQQRTALEQQARDLGLQNRVRFAGYQSDVLPYYAAMDVVALPSIAGEGLPRTLLEAGLLGRAAVASDLSGAGEIIRPGETGYLAPPGDVGALADRLTELLSEPDRRERFGARARTWIQEQFTPARMLEDTLAAYARLPGRRSA